MSAPNGIVHNRAISHLVPDYEARRCYRASRFLTVKQTTCWEDSTGCLSLLGSQSNDSEDNSELTHMVKLEMKAVEGRSTSKAASLVMGSWFHTELWTVVTA